ncbi:MAG: tetratricopeptide repeat protein [Holosporales bacterium]
MSDLISKAEQGDADFQYRLAKLYKKGRGVPQDFQAAFQWYRKAADQGDAEAIRFLEKGRRKNGVIS